MAAAALEIAWCLLDGAAAPSDVSSRVATSGLRSAEALIHFCCRHDAATLGRVQPLVQPLLQSVVAHGEANLVHFGGAFSHAIHKGARWDGDAEQSRGLVEPAADERALAQRVLAHVDGLGFGPLAYARVDVARCDATGGPLLMELEIVEPSLFLDRAPDRAAMLVDAVLGA